MRSLALLLVGLLAGATLLMAQWPDADGSRSGDHSDAHSGDQSSARSRDRSADEPDALRIASLSPALTRTIQMFGLESHLVGRSAYCTSVSPTIPAVGDLLAIDFERLVETAPSHVLVQARASGVDPALRRIAQERGWSLVEYVALDRIQDIESMVRDLPSRLGETRRDELERRATELVDEMREAMRPGRSAFTGRVLLVHDTESIGAFGRDTYLHEMLEALGARNALETSGWVTLGLEDVARLAPDGIIVVRAGPEADERIELSGPLAQLGDPVVLLSHPDVYYPAPSVAAVAAALEAALARLRILAE